MIKPINRRTQPFSAIALLLCIVMGAVSCKTEKLVPDVNEPVKDISGTWKVASATINGSDIMNTIPDNMTQLSTFSITFKDGKYSIQSLIPFIVNTDGNYATNDAQFPTFLTFTPNGGTAIQASFVYPVVQGQRQIQLTFSPGCPQNSYVYNLKKTN